jgi:hypothetical protein
MKRFIYYYYFAILNSTATLIIYEHTIADVCKRPASHGQLIEPQQYIIYIFFFCIASYYLLYLPA